MKLASSTRATQVRHHRPAAGPVLVLFPGALGDAVCLEPAIAHLSSVGPTTMYARGGAAEVATLFRSPPAVRSLDAIELARLFSPQPDDDDTAAWLATFVRIVSFTGASVPQVARRLAATGCATLAAFPRPPLAVHAADYFLRTVTGDPHAVGTPRLLAPACAPVRRAAPLLALLPGSAGTAKRAPNVVYAVLASRWRAAGGEVEVVLGPAEAGDDAAWTNVGRIDRPSSIADLAAALSRASAFVGNDSGPSHVAAALGVPGVVLFTVTTPGGFGPRGAEVTTVMVERHGHDDGTAGRAWHALRGHLP